MKSIFQESARRAIFGRLQALTPDHPRRWGRLTAGRMLAHVGDQLRMALGEIPSGPPRGPFRFFPLNALVIYVLPWPEGRAEAPEEAFTTPPGSWTEDRETLKALILRVAEKDPQGPWPDHPLFGKMSGKAWGVLSYRHLDHHLCQFEA